MLNRPHKTKLLIITNLFPNKMQPTRGIFNKQQFLELSQSCDVRVVAPLPWYSRINPPNKELVDGLTTYHPRYFMIPKIGRALYGIFFYWSLKGFVDKVFHEFPFNIILATWAYPDSFGTYLIGRSMNKPVLIKVHGSDINVYCRQSLRRRMISWALKRCDGVIAVSHALKEKIIGIGVPEDKIHVVLNGIDLEMFHPQDKLSSRRSIDLPLNKKIILYVGNLVLVKGVDVLIDAFGLLSRGREDLLLVLVGSGSWEQELREKVRKLSLEDSVVFAGRKDHGMIPKYINSCDTLCLPSINEGCPNVVLESIACERPVVASRVGGVAELIQPGDNGILVEPGDPVGLAKALSETLGKEWVFKTGSSVYTWRDNANKVLELVNAVKKR